MHKARQCIFMQSASFESVYHVSSSSVLFLTCRVPFPNMKEMWEQPRRQFKVFLAFEKSGSNQPDRRMHTVPWRCVFGKAVSDADVDQPYSNQRQGTKTALGHRELSSGRRQQARRNLPPQPSRNAHTHDTSRTSACADRTQPGDGVRNSGRQRARNLYWRRQQARRH